LNVPPWPELMLPRKAGTLATCEKSSLPLA